jgi:hypothetical protein
MAKLTLSVDEEVVEVAKRYAAQHGTSVSQLVEDYLRLVSRLAEPRSQPMPPILARWHGVLKGSGLDASDYREHLERKYR